MKKLYRYLIVSIVLSSLCACSTWHKLDKTERGAVIGTGTGAVIGGAGHGAGGALIGGVAGGVAGGLIGNELEDDN